ncbi:hypothetical protein [Levilactobacillus tujiorum]|uniref:Uncharacterized protein n=1 Tax=Levilactobacillus tujiorum TaxID=2912243 RepID=A0ABX1L4U4_9LACO|nr:hypothetical protein [Levilactobacillus tujiorum]MCH5464057.1 hypothetical protein [Levilactobacillus tujiorum]NLR11159.1 hypothetical protein [Lactobacillus sp. HBUAS51387]NLR29042.1 hypothetical protein [Levilactobacillus tujiorum]
MKECFLRYLRFLLYGVLPMGILLTWNLQNTRGKWVIPITAYTVWILCSWLLCFSWLRGKLKHLYSKNDRGMTSYKAAAMALHHRDQSMHHVDRRWTTNGVTSNPWEYLLGNTQSTDEILNPIYVFCEHLWMSLLLILFGPIIMSVWFPIILIKKFK